MLKKLLANKIVLICCGVLIAGTVICLVTSRDSKVHQKDNQQVEQEKTEQEGTEQENTGLEVKDYVDGNVDSVDGSGSWDDTSDNDAQKADTTPDNNNQKTDDTENNNNNNSNNNTADDRDEVDKQENILEDEKEWSFIIN